MPACGPVDAPTDRHPAAAAAHGSQQPAVGAPALELVAADRRQAGAVCGGPAGVEGVRSGGGGMELGKKGGAERRYGL